MDNNEQIVNESESHLNFLKRQLQGFINAARSLQEEKGRSEGARLLAISITETQKALGILLLAEQNGDL